MRKRDVATLEASVSSPEHPERGEATPRGVVRGGAGRGGGVGRAEWSGHPRLMTRQRNRVQIAQTDPAEADELVRRSSRGESRSCGGATVERRSGRLDTGEAAATFVGPPRPGCGDPIHLGR